jgi:bifunctional enzyme CysN/CysC
MPLIHIPTRPADPRFADHMAIVVCGEEGNDKRALLARLLSNAPTASTFHDTATADDPGGRDTRAGGSGPDPAEEGLAANAAPGNAQGTPWRYFSLGGRSYLVADIPGDAQHTRNLVDAAFKADIGVLVVDARHGVGPRTRHDGYLLSLIGVRHVLLAVNGMELVGCAREPFEQTVADFRAFADLIGLESWAALPVSGLKGDNIWHPSDAMDWHQGCTLAGWLETLKTQDTARREGPFRLAVQAVGGPDNGPGGLFGYVAGGTVRPGDRIRVQPLGKESRIARIFTAEGDLDQATAGQSVSLTLQDKIDIPTGSVISTVDAPAEVADQFEAKIIWMDDQPLYPGRTYLMKIGANTVSAMVTDIKYQVDVQHSLEHLAADKLPRDGIAVCTLALDRSIPFDAYDVNPDMGAFTVIDRLGGDTVGVGMLNFALRRAHNIHRQYVDIDKEARTRHKGHRACVLWFTGLSGSGKSTVANLVEQRLHAMGVHTYLLDGDNVRHGLNRDLGFTAEDRVENIRRVAEVSKLMLDAGLIVLTAFISPFRAERRMARELFDDGEFIEVFMDTPLEVAEQRDPKGLYKKARRGDLKNFTGIDSPYEVPEVPEVRLDTSVLSAEESAERVIALLRARRLLPLNTPTTRAS